MGIQLAFMCMQYGSVPFGMCLWPCLLPSTATQFALFNLGKVFEYVISDLHISTPSIELHLLAILHRNIDFLVVDVSVQRTEWVYMLVDGSAMLHISKLHIIQYIQMKWVALLV